VAPCHNSLAPPQSCHYFQARNPPQGGFRALHGALSYSQFKDTLNMRKIVLAAAIAGAALSLAACSSKTEDAASETADSAAADASANADVAASAVTGAAADATSATSEAATDATSTATTTETTSSTTTAD
jgi:hypothetical protein